MSNRLFPFLVGFILVLGGIIRFYKLSSLPPSPYWEEVALGYDAYSILKTGKDHHGNSFPIVAFESFGDWKPSAYFYSIVPFIYLFDLSLLAVRFPSAIAGVLIVCGTAVLGCFLSNQISKKEGKHNAEIIQFRSKLFFLISVCLVSISPWAILFSRGGWEVNLATSFIIWGIVTFFFAEKHTSFWAKYFFSITGVFFFVLSMYTYHAARVIAPLLGIGIVVLWMTDFFSVDKKNNFRINVTLLLQQLFPLIISGMIAIALLFPLINSLGSIQTQQRFLETSIFTDISIIERSNMARELSDNSLLSRIFYHRYWLFFQRILQNMSSYFSFDFLFISGDANPRHSSQFFGQLYHFDVIFAVLGSIFLIKKRNKYIYFLLYWLIVGIIPASISTVNPHALRSLFVMPVWLLIISSGVFWLFTSPQLKKSFQNSCSFLKKNVYTIALLLVVIGYSFEFFWFWKYYTHIYPIEFSQEWQYGYQQMVDQISNLSQEYPHYSIIISRENGRPAMFYWFFTKTDPHQVQMKNEVESKDQSEFTSYDSISFSNDFDRPTSIVAMTKKDYDQFLNKRKENSFHLISVINNLKEVPAWYIGVMK